MIDIDANKTMPNRTVFKLLAYMAVEAAMLLLFLPLAPFALLVVAVAARRYA